MITSVFFQNYNNDSEQRLLQNLVEESIRIYGMDVYYIVRDYGNMDKLYLTDDQSSYSNTYFVEMYLDNVLGFAGDQQFFSKVAGLEIRDQVIFTVSRQRFEEEIGYLPDPLNAKINVNRPREGDLIYFPLNKKCFQIKFVNQYEMFYQLGRIYTWQMTCELFEYSNEKFNTGVPDIDAIQKRGSLNMLDYAIQDTDNAPLVTEANDYLVWDDYQIDQIDPLADNIDIGQEEEANNYIDWSETNPFNEDVSNTSTHSI